MKDWVKIINSEGITVFSGNILDLPLKNDYVIKRSIELFDDADPCIIHRSYVIRKVVDEIKIMLKVKDQTGIALSPYKDQLSFLQFEDLTKLTIYFGVE